MEEDHLYVIRSSSFPGMVKVGRSNCPERRRLELSNGQPVQYELVLVLHGGGKHERAVHKHLNVKRHTKGHSREWFCVDADDVVEAYRAVTYPCMMDHLESFSLQVSTYEDIVRRAESAEAELRRRDAAVDASSQDLDPLQGRADALGACERLARQD